MSGEVDGEMEVDRKRGREGDRTTFGLAEWLRYGWDGTLRSQDWRVDAHMGGCLGRARQAVRSGRPRHVDIYKGEVHDGDWTGLDWGGH